MSPAIEITSFEVPVAGGELAVHRFGPADAPAVLAVHGITGNGMAWLPAAEALEGRVSLIAPDLRGRGASRELPPPYGSEAYVEDLIAVLDHLALARPLVAGHSLGAYVVARLGVEHPERVDSVLLVDGGLTLPDTEEVEDPQAFVEAFLGPALARLRQRFESREAYHAWWHQHPAFTGGDIAEEMLRTYVDHDLAGTAPGLHSSVLEEAVRVDAGQLLEVGTWAERLERPARLLAAPRGLLDEPNPMQPMALVEAWARGGEGRSGTLVEGVNHYTITLGARGARAVADAILQALPSAATA